MKGKIRKNRPIRAKITPSSHRFSDIRFQFKSVWPVKKKMSLKDEVCLV